MRQKTIKTLSSDVNVTFHQTNELLTKVNVLADDINIKVATIDPSLRLWQTCQSQYLISTNMHVFWAKKASLLVEDH